MESDLDWVILKKKKVPERESPHVMLLNIHYFPSTKDKDEGKAENDIF